MDGWMDVRWRVMIASFWFRISLHWNPCIHQTNLLGFYVSLLVREHNKNQPSPTNSNIHTQTSTTTVLHRRTYWQGYRSSIMLHWIAPDGYLLSFVHLYCSTSRSRTWVPVGSRLAFSPSWYLPMPRRRKRRLLLWNVRYNTLYGWMVMVPKKQRRQPL